MSKYSVEVAPERSVKVPVRCERARMRDARFAIRPPAGVRGCATSFLRCRGPYRETAGIIRAAEPASGRP
ncbi:hypothetical protein Afil01_06380 [Actinorhabdospora filicis]|uniref:Uncharacterized protein n=1 Tax=Actinorhabdospora filicis TaxID=1785913 RepID=A0A9W6W7U2_9ACTN|nr:hypothetical protein Afil01_06380 [Actinorhabdospora filicis]